MTSWTRRQTATASARLSWGSRTTRTRGRPASLRPSAPAPLGSTAPALQVRPGGADHGGAVLCGACREPRPGALVAADAHRRRRRHGAASRRVRRPLRGRGPRPRPHRQRLRRARPPEPAVPRLQRGARLRVVRRNRLLLGPRPAQLPATRPASLPPRRRTHTHRLRRVALRKLGLAAAAAPGRPGKDAVFFSRGADAAVALVVPPGRPAKGVGPAFHWYFTHALAVGKCLACVKHKQDALAGDLAAAIPFLRRGGERAAAS